MYALPILEGILFPKALQNVIYLFDLQGNEKINTSFPPKNILITLKEKKKEGVRLQQKMDKWMDAPTF